METDTHGFYRRKRPPKAFGGRRGTEPPQKGTRRRKKTPHKIFPPRPCANTATNGFEQKAARRGGVRARPQAGVLRQGGGGLVRADPRRSGVGEQSDASKIFVRRFFAPS